MQSMSGIPSASKELLCPPVNFNGEQVTTFSKVLRNFTVYVLVIVMLLIIVIYMIIEIYNLINRYIIARSSSTTIKRKLFTDNELYTGSLSAKKDPDLSNPYYIYKNTIRSSQNDPMIKHDYEVADKAGRPREVLDTTVIDGDYDNY